MRPLLGTGLLLTLILAGCSSGLLAPRSARRAEFTEKNKVKMATAYQRSKGWFDKNLQYVSGSPRVEEPDAGHMRMEAGYSCNLLRKDNDFKEYFLAFELDFEATAPSINLHFSDLRIETAEGELIGKPELQLSNVQNIDRIRPCLKKMVKAVLKAVESDTPTW